MCPGSGSEEESLSPEAVAAEELLSPLLREKKALASSFRIRNLPYLSKSVKLSSIDEWVEKGWEVVGKKTRVAKLRFPKTHDKILEDRLWCLMYRLGYESMNAERFTIRFTRSDGSSGRKQIDVFGCDPETAFVIECKSRERRDRRSLQKDLTETAALKDYLRQSIYKLDGGQHRPKIIWIYATNNIIWSDSDIDRANDAGITILTENEINYFEAFTHYVGFAARYQILGEILKGQKIPGLGDHRVPAIKGRIGDNLFFCFMISARHLLKIAFVNHQALNHPDGRPAYQRMISAKRLNEIGDFLEGGGFFPTNILVNFIDKVRWDLMDNKANNDENIKFGWITLPNKYRSAWIIDGQHRLYGYSKADEKFLNQSLVVIAFEKMSTRKEADLFITINHKQKSVPKSLLVALLSDIRMGDSDPKTALAALASAVVKVVNADKSGPFFRRFTVPGIPPAANQNLTISEVVNGLTRSGLLGRVLHGRIAPGPLSGRDDDETVERTRNVLNAYFEKLRTASPMRWEAGQSAYVAINPGVRAHLMLIGEIVSYLAHKKGLDFIQMNESDFVKQLCEVAYDTFEFVRTASDEQIKGKFSRKFGEGGVREYLYNLCEIVLKAHPDFGSEDFKNYISQKGSDRVSEANQTIIDIVEKMIHRVVSVLKATYGTKLQPSGEPAYWEKGIESRRARDNAYKKQQDDPSDKRLPKEAYLDILDIKDIVEQSNNWLSFQDVFDIPMSGETKGKRHHTAWMAKFNELRRIPAHKSHLRTYSEDDFEFLDWLKSEFYDRLERSPIQSET